MLVLVLSSALIKQRICGPFNYCGLSCVGHRSRRTKARKERQEPDPAQEVLMGTEGTEWALLPTAPHPTSHPLALNREKALGQHCT